MTDHKAEFLERELKRLWWGSVRLSGLTKYLADGCTVVHSGRPVPAAGDVVQHGEDVGFVHDPVMSGAWRNAVLLL